MINVWDIEIIFFKMFDTYGTNSIPKTNPILKKKEENNNTNTINYWIIILNKLPFKLENISAVNIYEKRYHFPPKSNKAKLLTKKKKTNRLNNPKTWTLNSTNPKSKKQKLNK